MSKTTKTSETTKTSKIASKYKQISEKVEKRNKKTRPWYLSRYYGSLISRPDPLVWHWACKDGWAQARRAWRHWEKADIFFFSRFEWYSGQNKKYNFLKKVFWSYRGNGRMVFLRKTAAFPVRTETFFYLWRKCESDLTCFYHSGVRDSSSSQSSFQGVSVHPGHGVMGVLDCFRVFARRYI